MTDTMPIVQMELSDLPPLPPLPPHVPDPPPPPTVIVPKPRFTLRRPDYKTLIYKSTSRSQQCAPPRYVNALTDLLNLQHASDEGQQIAAIAVANHLHFRLSSSPWTVQLKTHILLHHLLRHTPLPVTRYLSQTIHDALKHTPFEHPTTPVRFFISTYDTYLKRRTALTASFDFPPATPDEKSPQLAHVFQHASLDLLIRILPSILRVIDSLITTDMHSAIDLPLAIPAFTMLKRDLAVFCVTLASAMSRVVQLFDHFDNHDKAAAFRLVMTYTALVGRVKRFAVDIMDIPTRCPGAWAELPAIHGDVMRRMRLEARMR